MKKILSLMFNLSLYILIVLLFGQVVRTQETKVTATRLGMIDYGGYPYWSPDGKTLALKSKNEILIYDIPKDVAKAKIVFDKKDVSLEISFSPDSKFLLTQSEKIRIYDANNAKLIHEFAENANTMKLDKDTFFFRSVCEDQYNYVTQNYESHCRHPNSSEMTARLPFYNMGRSISLDWKSILVLGKNGDPVVYDLNTGELKFNLEPRFIEEKKKKKLAKSMFVELSADGKYIVTVNGDKTPRLYEANTGNWIADLTPQTHYVYGAQFSPDSRYVSTTSDDGIVKIWDASTGNLKHTIGGTDTDYFAAWNPNSKSFVTKTLKWDVKIWDAETGKLLCKLDNTATKEKFDESFEFIFSPNGKMLITQAKRKVGLSVIVRPGRAKNKSDFLGYLWDAETGRLIASLPINKTDPWYENLSDYYWSPDSKLFVTSGRPVRIWNQRGEVVKELGGYSPWDASFSPDGKFLITSDQITEPLPNTLLILLGKDTKDQPAKMFIWQLEKN